SRSNVFVHSYNGRIASPFVRYIMCLPFRRTRTNPTSRSTFRCFDTEGCSSPMRTTRSPTGSSALARCSRISRRRGSATAFNEYDVVAALAIQKIYSYIGICQAKRFSAQQRNVEVERSQERHRL